LTRPKSFSTPLKPPPPTAPHPERRLGAGRRTTADVPRPNRLPPSRDPAVHLRAPGAPCGYHWYYCSCLFVQRCALVGLGVRNDLTILGQRNDALVFIHALISAAVAYPCFYSLILLSWICCPMVALTEIYRSPEINLIYHLFLLLLLESRGMKN
jgi:hypothetical protein